MTYDFKCSQCGKAEEIFISVADISDKWVINQDKLQERIDEKRFCECGGQMKRVYAQISNAQIFMPSDSAYWSHGCKHRILQHGGTSGFNSKLRS